MQRDYFKLVFILILSFCIHAAVTAQLKVTVVNPDPLDSVNLSVTRKIVNLLEQQKVTRAAAYFKFKSESDRKNITKQLKKLSGHIRAVKAKTKTRIQTSFKNYKDSFNIDQVVYYNKEGRFYLFELFFLKNDTHSKVVDIFIKDLAALERERIEISEFRKKNPDIPLPPSYLPPGLYMKERNN